MKRRHPFRNTITWSLLLLNLIAVVGTIWSGYGGFANPKSSPISALMCLALPLWLIFDLIVIVLDIWLRRRMLSVIAIGLIATAGPILTFSPLNLPHEPLSDKEKLQSFTLLTYNVMNFADTKGIYPDEGNLTIDYILSTDASMIFLQEVVKRKIKPEYNITKAQQDSLKARYPYRSSGRDGLLFLSKYPFEETSFPREKNYSAELARYVVDVDGRKLTVYGVHLQSLELKADDRRLFRELTDMNISKDELRGIRSQLLSKFKYAGIIRADQSRRLLNEMGDIEGDIIVCGDFNDVAGSFSYRMFTDVGFRDAYADVAFGPTITYHANHFFFRIDQVLYHGNITPVDITRGNLPSSDHYPLLTTFLWQ